MNNIEKAKLWLADSFDAKTREDVQALLDGDPKVLEEAFYKNLEFGTGGMRGIMGVGTNRLNKYTLGAATQGLANYLKEQFPNQVLKVAVAHDVRHNSRDFMNIVADVLSANGIKTLIFDSFRPTPQLSYTVRTLDCNAGIVLTASHNPPEYNGYKAYWNDGAQVVPPHDKGIIDKVSAVDFDKINFNRNEDLIELLDNHTDDQFIKDCVEHGVVGAKEGYDSLKIVFTPLHGTAIKSIPDALSLAGFENVYLVDSQVQPSGDFPTVKSPNPEEPEALKEAIDLAKVNQADIVIGTDPDADRLGIAVPDDKGDFILLNGNQTNTILTNYLLSYLEETGDLNESDFIGSTIVTSDIFIDLANKYGVECKRGLTGFKWIGKMIREAEGKQKFICGGEESFGFMVGDFVRDKDSVTSTVLACHIAANAKANGSSFYNELQKIYTTVPFYQEKLISLKKPGLSGAVEIKEMMDSWRKNAPTRINNKAVVKVEDYLLQQATNVADKSIEQLSLPKSNVLIFYTEDGTKVAARPSGTEPKIKFYISVKENLNNIEDFDKIQEQLNNRIFAVEEELMNN